MALWRRLGPVKLKFLQLKCFLDKTTSFLGRNHHCSLKNFFFFFKFSAAVKQRRTKEIQNVVQDYFTVLQRQWQESRGKSSRSDVTKSSLTLLGRVIFKLEKKITLCSRNHISDVTALTCSHTAASASSHLMRQTIQITIKGAFPQMHGVLWHYQTQILFNKSGNSQGSATTLVEDCKVSFLR